MALAKLLCLVALLSMASIWPARAQAQQVNPQQDPGISGRQTLRLSPEAAQVAEQIGVAPLLDQLGSKRAAGSPMNLELLAVRQEITEKALAASLDVDSVNAIIDSEIEQAVRVNGLDITAS